jgi:peptidoglycan/xylan/chitin deacetylase (PgdA/CDA1 family)
MLSPVPVHEKDTRSSETIGETVMFYFMQELFFFFLRILSLPFPRKSPVILMYHSVDSSGSQVSVSETKFIQQMKLLIKSGNTVVPLGLIKKWMKGHEELPPGAVALTFDDGFENNLAVFRFLNKHRLPVTVFLVAEFLGKNNDWRHSSLDAAKIMNLRQARSLAASFVEIGSHTLTHKNLSTLNYRDAFREIAGSRKLLQKSLKLPIPSFCYPFGKFTKEVKSIVLKAGYTLAVSVKPGHVEKNSDPFSLPRIPVSERTSENRLRFYLSSIALCYFRLRNHLKP